MPRSPSRRPPLSPSHPRRSSRLAAQSSSAASDPAERFGLTGLTVLPIPNINDITIVFEHAQELYTRLEQDTLTPQDTLIYYNATTSHLDALRSADTDGQYPGRITFFGDEIGLVFFRVLKPTHETAHLLLFRKIEHMIFQMGLADNYIPTGSAEYKGTGTKKKQGDSGLLPRPPRWAANHYPTLVIEAGNSESLPRLHKDKDWWFNNSPPNLPQGDVRVVLLIKVYPQTKRIIVEQWHCSLRQSPSTTVIIKQHPRKPFSLHDSSHWVVEGAPMVIPFQEVFLRPKQGQDTDIILTNEFFADMAVKCWERDTVV
ncbi:hypothetical protein OQA88_3257 [Cercophora sp. LCS_1]